MAQEQISARAKAALESLAEIASPPPVSWMPQTWGWVALAVVLSLVLATWAWRRRQRALANRYRVEALAALSALEKRARDPQTRADALLQIAELIKRTALAAFARTEVAQLSGTAWVRFIREKGLRSGDDAARLLDDLEYRPRTALAAMSDADATAVVRAARAWIEEHHVPA